MPDFLRSTNVRRLGAIVFLALWIVVPFWEIATLRAVNVQDDMFASDLLNDRLPARAFVGRSLRAGELPLWAHEIYTGFPMLAAVEVGALYPSNWLLFGLLPPYVAIAYAQLLPLFIGALGAFLLCRQVGGSYAGALLAGGSFGFSGFFVSHLRQLNMVDAACWIPLLLLLVERGMRHDDRRALILLAIGWCLQLLAGHPQMSYFTFLVLLAHAVVRGLPLGSTPRASRRLVQLAMLGAAFAVGTAMAGAQLVPTVELSDLSRRQAGLSFEDAARYPVSAWSALTFFAPYLYGDPAEGSFDLSGIFWEQYGYFGLLPMVLAIVAALARRSEAYVRWLVVLAIGAYLMVLGSNTPLFHLTYQWLPGMAYFRFPTRFLVFVILALGLLAGLGLDWCSARIDHPLRRSVLIVAVLMLTAIDLRVHQMRQVPMVPWERWLASTGTEKFLAEARRQFSEPFRYYSLDSRIEHIQAYHAARPAAGDLSPFVWLRALLQPSSNLLHGFETPDGYANLVPRHYEAVWGSEKQRGLVVPPIRDSTGGLSLEPSFATLLRLFNVRFLLSPRTVSSAELALVAQTGEGISIYGVKGSLPRAYVVGKVHAVVSDEEALERLKSPNFDPANEALVHDTDLRLDDPPRSTDRVEVRQRDGSSLRLAATVEASAFLVVSEGWLPGWEVIVDGKPAALVRTNVMMRGVMLEAGTHDVEFRYRPRAVRWGFLTSLIGIVALFGWAWRCR